MTFGQLVKQAREMMGLSQEEASSQIKKRYPEVRITGSYLCMIENDQKKNLTIYLIDALIEFFKLDPSSVQLLLSCGKNKSFGVFETADEYKINNIRKENDFYNGLTPEEQAKLNEYREFLIYLRKQKHTTLNYPPHNAETERIAAYPIDDEILAGIPESEWPSVKNDIERARAYILQKYGQSKK